MKLRPGKAEARRETLPVPFAGEPFEIGFNPEFLRDGLESGDLGPQGHVFEVHRRIAAFPLDAPTGRAPALQGSMHGMAERRSMR